MLLSPEVEHPDLSLVEMEKKVQGSFLEINFQEIAQVTS